MARVSERRLRDMIKVRLDRCARLRQIGAPSIVLKREQYMLLRHRRGFLSQGVDDDWQRLVRYD